MGKITYNKEYGWFGNCTSTECEDYYGFKTNSRGLEVIDNDMLTRATERVDIIKSNKDVMALLMEQGTDWDLDYGKLLIIALCIYIAVQVS